MKKALIIASVCLMASFTAFAQDNMSRRSNGQRMMRNIDNVVDTAVINHIGLADATLQQVYNLQKGKMEEQKQMMQESRHERGQKLSDSDRKEMQEKRQAFTDQYRKELRSIIGDAAYVTYLEKMLDRQSSMRFGRMNGGQRPNGQGGPRGGNGDMDI